MKKKRKILIKDKNYHGFINSLENDDRAKKYLKQYKKRGFDDSETWALYFGIAKYILPRLKRFREIPLGYPMGLSEMEWDEILADMITAFEIIVEDDFEKEVENEPKVKKGLDLFAKWFRNLWT